MIYSVHITIKTNLSLDEKKTKKKYADETIWVQLISQLNIIEIIIWCNFLDSPYD